MTRFITCPSNAPLSATPIIFIDKLTFHFQCINLSNNLSPYNKTRNPVSSHKLMKAMSLFLLKNSLGETKMKKTSYYNEGSTSTLNKQNSTNNNSNNCKVSSLALQDLMLQFELEAKLKNDFNAMRRRMSCVNDSLRPTRRGLNQYPRLSLDGGRDAINRSSFGNIKGRRSVCCDRRLIRGGLLEENDDLLGSRFDKGMSLPHTLAGESVVWCKPGLVARLMGLEAIPLPMSSIRSDDTKEKILAVFRMQNPIKRFGRA